MTATTFTCSARDSGVRVGWWPVSIASGVPSSSLAGSDCSALSSRSARTSSRIVAITNMMATTARNPIVCQSLWRLSRAASCHSSPVKYTTTVSIISGSARLINVPSAPSCTDANLNAHNAIEPNPR
jgi:hypothetical protein